MRGISFADYLVSDHLMTMQDFKNALPNDLIPASFVDKEDYFEFIESTIGYNFISIEEQLQELEMLQKLLERFFASSGSTPKNIDYLILAVEQPLANLGHLLLQRLGFENTKVLVISGNNCVNIEIAIDMAVKNEYFGNSLIVSYAKHQKLEDRIFGSFALKGDGAGLVYIDDDAKISLVNTQVVSHGQLTNNIENTSMIHFKYYIKVLKDIVKHTGVNREDIAKLYIQSANPLLYIEALNTVGFDTELVYKKNIEKYGHLDGVDTVINIKEFMNNGNPKQLALAISSGWLGTYTASMMQYIN